MSASLRNPDPRPAAPPRPEGQGWLLLVHQLPARPTSLRVRTWRRLQQVGAIAVKQAVYVLPDSSDAREDFEWLRTEIEAAGGHASVFAADTVDTWSNDALVDEFRKSREAGYASLARDADRLVRSMGDGRRRRGRVPSRRAVEQLRQRLSAIERVDFFGSAGRDRVLALIRQIEERTNPRSRDYPGAGDTQPVSHKARLWVTRPRPGVDRMASAWLIRRFIDAEARFDFVADRAAAPPESVPFDMFGVEFTHRGELCTFEKLRERFNLDDPALGRIAAIVHDLDLKDDRFGAADAPTVGVIVEGLRLARGDDHELLADGMTLFDALYRALTQAALTSGPRPLAKRKSRTPSRSGRRH